MAESWYLILLHQLRQQTHDKFFCRLSQGLFPGGSISNIHRYLSFTIRPL